MIKNTIKKLNANTNLSYAETKDSFTEILNGKATMEQINDFISALGNKNETAHEIAGSIDAFSTYSLESNNHNLVLNKLGLRKDYSNSLNF